MFGKGVNKKEVVRYNQPVIININKPRTWTSFDVVSYMRKKLNTKHIGHAGTLDPLATGVLLILTDADTKKQTEFMEQRKEYISEVVLGAFSETYDMEQIPILSANIPSMTEVQEKVGSILESFIGEQDQTAPAYSAKKVNGKVLYKEARHGRMEGIALPVKHITIFDIQNLGVYETSVVTDKGAVLLPTIKIKITCSSGTYIRSLAVDIAKAFGTEGVMFSLVRTAIGDYRLENAQSIEG